MANISLCRRKEKAMDIFRKIGRAFITIIAMVFVPIFILVLAVALDISKYVILAILVILFPVFLGIAIGYALTR